MKLMNTHELIICYRLHLHDCRAKDLIIFENMFYALIRIESENKLELLKTWFTNIK